MLRDNPDFYPTPTEVADRMLYGIDLVGKTVLEPSAGKGDLVEAIKSAGASTVLCCEKHPDLATIVSKKARLIANDFLSLKSEDISHIDCIIGNPPFSTGASHILHAYSIAPSGCTIVMLCNLETLTTRFTRERQELKSLIDLYGHYDNLGECFTRAERTTDVKVALVRLTKPHTDSEAEFSGFFMEEDQEAQSNGLISYNVIRDVVNRYVQAIKLYDKQLELATQMHDLTNSFFKGNNLSMSLSIGSVPASRAEFKKVMQKDAWLYILGKVNMEKYTTKGLKEDINKFVNNQTNIPFTMRNVYQMLQMIIGTSSQLMDRAMVEVFDKLTYHYSENRYNVEGWKTNSHYLVNEKFIMPSICNSDWGNGVNVSWGNDRAQLIDDLVKALCYITGTNYDTVGSIQTATASVEVMENGTKTKVYKQWGTWYDWGFFQYKAFKKGTMHFKFKDRKVWALFNQNIARIKGYPLPEAIK